MDTIIVICEFPILVQSTTDAEEAEDHESASQWTLCTDMVPFLVWLLSWHRMQSPLSASGAPFEHFPDGKPVDMFRMEFRSIFIRTSLHYYRHRVGWMAIRYGGAGVVVAEICKNVTTTTGHHPWIMKELSFCSKSESNGFPFLKYQGRVSVAAGT